MSKLVVVEVSGGVSEVTHVDEGVEVYVHDHDNEKENPHGYTPQVVKGPLARRGDYSVKEVSNWDEEAEELVDSEWCAKAAERLGMNQVPVEEAFLGEDKVECELVIVWIEREEWVLREKFGRREGIKLYRPKRMLRNWACCNLKGSFKKYNI